MKKQNQEDKCKDKDIQDEIRPASSILIQTEEETLIIWTEEKELNVKNTKISYGALFGKPPQNFCFLKKALPLLRYFIVNIYLEKSGFFGTLPPPPKKNKIKEITSHYPKNITTIH